MPRADNYFAAISEHFLRSIYHTPKGAIRLAVLQRDLAPYLETAKKRHILDIGGGAGQMAFWCAALGHQVTLIDRSEPLLEQARATADALELTDRITFICADALTFFADKSEDNEQQRQETIGLQLSQFDGVFCHAVLEWVADGEKLLRVCTNAVASNGFLSLMYYNYTAQVFTQHVFGNFSYIDSGFKSKQRAKLTPDYPRTIEWVEQQLIQTNLCCQSRSGIRTFFDYMKPRDVQINTLDDIIAHELTLSSQAIFHPVSRYIHEIWKKC